MAVSKDDPRYKEFEANVSEVVEKVLKAKEEDHKKSTTEIVKSILAEDAKSKKSWLDDFFSF